MLADIDIYNILRSVADNLIITNNVGVVTSDIINYLLDHYIKNNKFFIDSIIYYLKNYLQLCYNFIEVTHQPIFYFNHGYVSSYVNLLKHIDFKYITSKLHKSDKIQQLKDVIKLNIKAISYFSDIYNYTEISSLIKSTNLYNRIDDIYSFSKLQSILYIRNCNVYSDKFIEASYYRDYINEVINIL